MDPVQRIIPRLDYMHDGKPSLAAEFPGTMKRPHALQRLHEPRGIRPYKKLPQVSHRLDATVAHSHSN